MLYCSVALNFGSAEPDNHLDSIVGLALLRSSEKHITVFLGVLTEY